MKIKNLFKNPKTNWKYLAIVAVFAVIAGGVVLAYINGMNKEINFFNSISEIKIPEKAVEKKGVENKLILKENKFAQKGPLELFMDARINNNKEQALSFIDKNSGAEVMFTQDSPTLSLIDKEFDSYKILFRKKFSIGNKYLVQISLKNGKTFNELIFMYSDNKVVAVSRNDEYGVVFYNQESYLVLKEKINPFKKSENFLVGQVDFSSECSRYTNTKCAYFVQQNDKIRYLNESWEYNILQFLDENTILIDGGFSEGGYDSLWIDKVDLKTGKMRQIIYVQENYDYRGVCRTQEINKEESKLRFEIINQTCDETLNEGQIVLKIYGNNKELRSFIFNENIVGSECRNCYSIDFIKNAQLEKFFEFKVGDKTFLFDTVKQLLIEL